MHEGFDPLASLFKKYELIYVVGEERDIVGVRTNFRDEDVYVYRLRLPAENARQLFLVYLARINQLADRPEFYHLLSNSCTVNIVRFANLVGSQRRLRFPALSQRLGRPLFLRHSAAERDLAIRGAAAALTGQPVGEGGRAGGGFRAAHSRVGARYDALNLPGPQRRAPSRGPERKPIYCHFRPFQRSTPMSLHHSFLALLSW